MEKKTQLEFLKGKFKELTGQYLDELKYGNSLQQIKDLSYVLNCISREIEMLERDVQQQSQRSLRRQSYRHLIH